MGQLEKLWRWLFALGLILACACAVWLRGLPALPETFALPPAEDVMVVEPDPVETDATLHIGAYTIWVGDTPLCTLESLVQAQELLQWYLNDVQQSIPAGHTLLRVELVEPVSIREAVMGEAIIPAAEAQAQLTKNPGSCPVRCITQTVESEAVPFETEEGTLDQLPKDVRMVQVVGKQGEIRTTTTYQFQNGVEVGKPVVTEQLTLKPTKEVVVVGTYVSDRPNKEPGRQEGESGKDAPWLSLQAPCKGDILSNYGTRKGSMHYGLDYACKVGDPVLAMERGTVVYVGERGNYGLLIELDHGEGFITRMVCLQNVLVAVGDTVEQGQQVASLAAPMDEERSPHLHIELLIDGLPYNPRQYLE